MARRTLRRGRLSRRSTIGPLRHGDLTRLGYSTKTTEARRHLALARAVAEYGALSVWRKLNAVYVYNRRTAPVASATFKADRDWVGIYYGVRKSV